MTGSTLGIVLGGIVGGAYLAGGYAQAASTHARVSKLADVTSGGYSEADLQKVVDRMDDSALSIARRHDPFTTAGAAQRDRQAALFAARLERRADGKPAAASGAQGLLMKASLGTPSFNPAAQPFRLDGALEASRDIECLTQAVYYEARGETPAGQAAVAQVVLNRVRHPAFPKTICGVVFQGAYGRGACQFSFACDGSMRRGRESGAWSRAEKVASRALSGVVMGDVGNATHFHTIKVSPGWGPRMIRVGQVGLHVFYRFGGRIGAPGSFDRAPERSGPQIGDRPIFASAGTSGPVPYTSFAPSDGAVFIAATATTPKPIEVADAMGGPAGKPVEPASAPKPAKPSRAEAAAEASRPSPSPSAAS